MVLKNRSHVATQTSLDETTRKDEQKSSVDHTEDIGLTRQTEEEIKNNGEEQDTDEIEIIDKESIKED